VSPAMDTGRRSTCRLGTERARPRAILADPCERTVCLLILGGHPRRYPLCGRRAVWWDIDAGRFRVRSLNIYARNVETVSLGIRNPARALQRTKKEPETPRTRAELEGPTLVGSNVETNGDWKFLERLRGRAGRCRQPTGTQITGGKEFGSVGQSPGGRLVLPNPKMSFLGFYQPILAFGVSRRNRPSVTYTKHGIGKKPTR
jgi:hypothetical protein